MMTPKHFRDAFLKGALYAEQQHQQASAGLLGVRGSCGFPSKQQIRSAAENKYSQYISSNTTGNLPPDSHVYAYHGSPSRPPGIRAFTPLGITGRDALAGEMAPAGVEVHYVGTLRQVLLNPDKQLPERWLSEYQGERKYGHYEQNTIYDRLEPADNVEVEIPPDITLTIGDEEYEVQNFSYDTTRVGDTVKFEPERIRARSTENITIDF